MAETSGLGQEKLTRENIMSTETIISDNTVVTSNAVTDTYFRPYDFQITDGARAYVDANGTFRTVFDEEADSKHSKVSAEWRQRCIPAADLFARVYSAAEHNLDIKTPESNVRITDKLTLPDGTGFTHNGLRSLMFFADIPVKMQDWLLMYEQYVPDLARYCNESLDRREIAWAERDKEPRSFLVRMRKQEDGKHIVRAVLSDKYARFDNHEACCMIENAIGNMDDVLVSHGWTNYDSIMMDLLLPDALKDAPSSQWGVGFSFSNNEVGSGTFSVEPYVFRTITRRGYRWGGFSTIINVNQRHIGNINYSKLEKDVKRAIDIALTEGRSMLNILSMAQMVQVNDPAVVIAGLVNEAKMNRGDAELVARQYVKNQYDVQCDKTAFGIVEAISATASESHGERRTALESTAGRIVAPNLKASFEDIEKHWQNIESTAVRRVDEDTVQNIRDIISGAK